MENPPAIPPPPAIETTIPFSEIYNLLTSYHQTTGSLSLPLSHPTTLRILDVLSSLQMETTSNNRWEERFEKLKNYKRRHGNCAVETISNDVNDDLKDWVVLQRGCYRNYEVLGDHGPDSQGERMQCLTTERYLKLKNVGLTVNKWEKRLMELRQHKLERGHCDVPINYPGGLGIWCATQRETYKFEKDSMPRERIEALDAIGFSWSRWGRQRSKARKDAWDKMFHALIEYKNVNGDCNISQYDENNKQLGKWAKNQRYEYRRYTNPDLGLGQSRISIDRIQKLESIGFQWRLKPEKISWDERFEALKRYKEEYGHCRPPQNHPEVGSWAKYQRNQLQYFLEGKTSKINQEKADKLISIGFNEPPPARSEDEDNLLQHIDNPEMAELHQRKRARRIARLKKTPEQQHHLVQPMHPSPHHTHHLHNAFQPYQDQNMQPYPPAPPYDFDATASHLDNFYQGYDQGTPITLQDGTSQFSQNAPVYHQHGYDDQYHYPTGV